MTSSQARCKLSEHRIYLDNAATSWPKPAAVVDALAAFYRRSGRPAGRGEHAGALRSGQIVADVRQRIARLLESPPGGAVVMAHNGTDALNLAIQGMLGPGDRVLCSPLEHNSVLRPLYALRERINVRIDWIGTDATGQIVPGQVQEMLREPARLVCLSHACNVSGVVADFRGLGTACRAAGAFLLVDASQTLGKLPVRVGELDCDLLAGAAHKGLFGPLGTGFLWIGSWAAGQIVPSRFGGTGGNSEAETQPAGLPERLEAGNLDVGGLSGLAAGLDFVVQTGVAAIQEREQILTDRLLRSLSDVPGVARVGEAAIMAGAQAVSVISLVFEGRDPHEVAAILDASFGIEVRAGLHCSPLAAAVYPETRGAAGPTATLRISPGWYNTEAEMDRLSAAIREILSS